MNPPDITPDNKAKLDATLPLKEGATNDPRAKGKNTVAPIDEQTIVQSNIDDSVESTRLPNRSIDSHAAAATRIATEQFGDYEIIEEIARGGMGVVYEAVHRQLNRTVALKMILKGEFASSADVERFYLEAKAAAGLDHPGIVPVYEVGELDGKQFFAMAFIEGGSLSDRVKKGPLGNREAATITKGIVEAIAYAHDHGVIHRDLKPGNILIGVDGQPKVTDFGLAKKVADDSGLTHTGQILGTPSYMPPEQAAGDAAKVGPAADIYALGAILYCLLTGKPPFQSAKAIDTIMLVLKEEPLRPSLLNPAVSADLETICLRCLEKSPQKRYSSAKAFAEELDRYLKGEPILARPVGSVERVTRWCFRHPWIAVLSATAVILLLLGATVSSAFGVLANRNAVLAYEKAQEASENYRTSERQRKRADANAAIAESRELKTKGLLLQVKAEKEKTQRELETSQRLLNLNHIQSAAREWKSSHASSAWEHLDAYRGTNFEWEHQYLFNLFTKNHQTLVGHRDEVNAIDVSPDERLLVSASGHRWSSEPVCEVKVWNLESKEALFTLSDFHSPVNDVAFHPSGKTFALATANGIVRVCSAETGKTIASLPPKGGVNAVAFGNKGRLLALAGIDGVIRLWNASSKEITELVGDTGAVNALAFTPDDKYLLTGSEKVATLWDTATGEKLRVMQGHSNAVQCVALDSTGRRAVTGAWDGSIVVWNIETGEIIARLSGHNLSVFAVAFGLEEGRIISASYDQTIVFWDLDSQRASQVLEGHTGSVYDVKLTNGGSRLISASADGAIKIWDPKLEDQTLTFREHSAMVAAVAFSPNGAIVASTSDSLKLWDPLTGEMKLECEGPVFGAAIAFNPRGDRIAAATWNGELIVWDTTNGQEQFRQVNENTSSLSVAYSHSGDQIAIGSNSGSIVLLNAQSGDILRKIEHGGEVKGIVFTLDDRAIIAGSTSGLVQSWNVKTGEPMVEFIGPKEPVYTMAISADGKLLATGGPTPQIFLWDTRTGELVDTLKSRLIQIYAISIGSAGKRLIAGGSDGSLELWDVDGAERTIVLEGHESPVISVDFSEDGTQIVSGSRDTTARVWNASTTDSGNLGRSVAASSGVENAQWMEPSDKAFPSSQPSAIHSLLVVENRSNEAVVLYWSDWDAQRVEWTTIEPGGVYRQTTYKGHAWILADLKRRDLGCLISGDSPIVVIASDKGVALLDSLN